MANTFTLNGAASYQGRYMYVTCTQTPDIASNTSTINWTLTVTGGTSNYYDSSVTLTINGTQVYTKGLTSWDSYAFPAAKGSVSGSLKVSHNSLGNATIAVSLSNAVYYHETKNASASWTLDAIPRKATITAAPNFNDEENPTITYSNPAGNNVSSLQACISFDGSHAEIAYRDIGKTGTSYTFNLTDAERSVLRQGTTGSNSRTVKFFVRTKIGDSSFLSSATKTFTIINGKPTLNPSVKDTLAAALTLTGNANTIIKGYNKISYTTGASAQKEATLTAQSITYNNSTASGASGTINNATTGAFTFKATDNRGNTTTKNVTLQMIDYFAPTCNIEATIALSETDGTKANIEASFRGKAFGDSFGKVTNELTLTYTFKTATGTVIATNIVKPTVVNGSYAVKTSVSDVDYRESYVIEVTAQDKIKTVKSYSKELRAIPVFDWGESDFNFNVPVKIGGVEIDYIVEQGVKNGWYYKKWNSGAAECWYSAEVTGIDVGEFNMNGFYYCGSKGVNFPFTFKSVHYINATGGSTGNMNIVRPFGNSLTNMTYVVMGNADISSATVRINLEAKGFWR